MFAGRRKIFVLSIGIVLVTLIASGLYLGCLHSPVYNPKDGVELAIEWNRFILKAERSTEGYRGPVASRLYGYVGVAAYQAAVPGLPGDFYPVSIFFPELKLPPFPEDGKLDLAISLNACYSAILAKFFLSTPETIKKERVEMYDRWKSLLEEGTDPAIISTSIDYGRKVADAVYDWSATDSLGYRANHHNYDRNYIAPKGDGKWVTSVDFPMPSLLPYWGKVRPFIIHTEEYLAKPLPPYSLETNQPYYIQALELISLSKPLSSENQWIAEFWHDDYHGITFTPPGHWLEITNQVIEKEHPPIEKTLETYLKVGISLADAMIACWNSKYTYNMERPETFIQNHIDKNWRPHVPTPSFPSYPSGHSMMGAAAAEVLTSMYGSSYELTDRSHKDLPDIQFKPRHFTSFDQMAKENALSRILLGVHWRMDCEEGLRLGSLIGKEVSQMEVERKLTE